MDFEVGLVDFILHLPDGQEVFGKFLLGKIIDKSTVKHQAFLT